jgi:hypothetical protein
MLCFAMQFNECVSTYLQDRVDYKTIEVLYELQLPRSIISKMNLQQFLRINITENVQ